MALAPSRNGRGTQEGHDPRIHSGNLTGAWQQRPQPARLPPGIHEPHFPLTMFFPAENIPAKVVVLLWHSCQASHRLICLVPLDPGIWQYFALKVEETFSTACETRFSVYVFPMSVCFCVKQTGETLGEEKKSRSYSQWLRTEKGLWKLRRRVNKLVVSHVPLPILSSPHCLPNLHPALLPEP